MIKASQKYMCCNIGWEKRIQCRPDLGTKKRKAQKKKKTKKSDAHFLTRRKKTKKKRQDIPFERLHPSQSLVQSSLMIPHTAIHVVV